MGQKLLLGQIIFLKTIFSNKNDVFLSGNLKDSTKPGTAWFYLFNNE